MRATAKGTAETFIEKLFAAIEDKQTHKACIVRDSLMTALALKSGIRRGGLAKLEVNDVHLEGCHTIVG